jgi:hypothetical protein
VSYQHEMPADWRMEAEELHAECDQVRKDLETVIAERRDAQNDLARGLEERDRLQAQLDAERQGALAREQALEGARAVANELALEILDPTGEDLQGLVRRLALTSSWLLPDPPEETS